MKFKNLFLLSGILLITVGCQSTPVERKTVLSLELDEISGIKSYQKGEYKKSFELLKIPATWGYKGSQYMIAFMFLKGQHVQQSTLLGMAWLAVATEMETEDWSDQYRALYSSSPPKQKLKIDKIVEEYIRRYGMKSQHVICKKSATIRTRKVKHVCSKSDRLSTIYEIDLVE
jgi:TPR repeat protein